MPYKTMWSYLWDFVDEGIDEALPFLRDEVGLDAISVATSYHTVEHLRPHGKGPVWFRSDGALYFQPEVSLYTHTRIAPRPSPWLGSDNHLLTLADRCRSLDMKLISWTVCCHNSNIGSRYPECAQHDAFGIPYPPGLCPADNDVREYLKAVVTDLVRHYHIHAIEVESLGYDSWRHTHHHDKIGVPLGPVEHFLMGLCFCGDCCDRAREHNVDTDRLRESVQSLLRASWSEGVKHGGTVKDIIAALPGLEAYLDMRVGVVTTLTREIQAICEAHGSLLVCMDMGSPAFSGFEMQEILPIADRIELLCYTDSAERVESAVKAAAEKGVPTEKMTMGLCAYPPAVQDAESLRKVTAKASDLGVRSFSFYNYGIMPKKNLLWVRDALKTVS